MENPYASRKGAGDPTPRPVLPTVEYFIVSAGKDTLQREVNRLIAEGWLPVGGVSATADWFEYERTIEYTFHQAMTRRRA